jgi:hypothetical protein
MQDYGARCGFHEARLGHMGLSVRGYILAVKYWLQGEAWKDAKECAQIITGWAEKK